MKNPVTSLRTSIDAWRHDECMERARRWLRTPDALTTNSVAEVHRRLVSDVARELFEEARSLGLLDANAESLLAAHLARAGSEAVLADVRDSLEGVATRAWVFENKEVPALAVVDAMLFQPRAREATARFLEQKCDATVARLEEARIEANEAVRPWLTYAATRPDAGPALDALTDEARAFLAATRDAAFELLERASTQAQTAIPTAWDDLIRLLRAPRLDSFAPRRERFRRVGSLFAPLGLERELQRAVRVVGAHAELDVRSRVLPVHPPSDVRIAFSPIEFGVVSEMAALEATARSLSLCLMNSALPVETRRPLDASVSRSVGALAAHLCADSIFWRKSRGLGRAESESLATLGALVALLDARLAAGAILARQVQARSGEERRAQQREILRGALCEVRVTPAMAALVAQTPAAWPARFRARRAALSLHVAFRDRFDEDWFQNPRVSETLRSLTAQGGNTSIENECARESLSLSHATERAQELASR